MSQIITKHKVLGSSRYWEVAEWNDGHFSCNCPAWIYHRGSKIDCKHILDYKNQKSEQTLIIQGIEAKNEKDIKNEAHNSVIGKDSDTSNDITLTKIGELLK